MRELARVLQKQGHVVITLPNFYNPVVLWRMLIKGKNTSQAYDCPIPYRKLLRELDQVGLSLVTISSFYIRYPFSRLVPRGIDKVMTYLMEKINKIVPVKLYLFICLEKP